MKAFEGAIKVQDLEIHCEQGTSLNSTNDDSDNSRTGWVTEVYPGLPNEGNPKLS